MIGLRRHKSWLQVCRLSIRKGQSHHTRPQPALKLGYRVSHTGAQVPTCRMPRECADDQNDYTRPRMLDAEQALDVEPQPHGAVTEHESPAHR